MAWLSTPYSARAVQQAEIGSFSMGRERLLIKEHSECALILNPAVTLAQLFLQQSLVFSTIGAEVLTIVPFNRIKPVPLTKKRRLQSGTHRGQLPQEPLLWPLQPLSCSCCFPAGLGSGVAYADFMGEN